MSSPSKEREREITHKCFTLAPQSHASFSQQIPGIHTNALGSPGWLGRGSTA